MKVLQAVYYPYWKRGLLLGILLLGVLYALPNLFPDQPVIQIAPLNREIFQVSSKRLALIEKVRESLQTSQVYPKQYGFRGGARGPSDLSVLPVREDCGSMHNEPENQTASGIQPIGIQSDPKQLTLRFETVTQQLMARDHLSQVLGEDYTIAVNLLSTTPYWLQCLGAHPMKLGLDLRGGVHFSLAIDTHSLEADHLSQWLKQVDDYLGEIRHLTLRESPKLGRLVFRKVSELQVVFKQLARQFPNLQFHAKDFEGHPALQLQISKESLQRLQKQAIEKSVMILHNRVNELGITEAVIQQQGEDHIIVDLPGVQDMTRAQQILGGTATLGFRLVTLEGENLKQAVLPSQGKTYQYQGQPIVLDLEVVLTGAAIIDAFAGFDDIGRPVVSVTLGSEERKFAQVTREQQGRLLAIVYVENKPVSQVVEGKTQFVSRRIERIISIARIASRLGRQFQITGLSEREASELALLLRAGTLPTSITIVEQSIIGPQLGIENIRLGFRAIVGGWLIAMLFMGCYYGRFGWIANVTLVINLTLLIAILSLLGMTLTLPGMAGILLTVALAVDAEVLIFERIREELHSGASVPTSIQVGYTRAWTAILDANVTTLIIASALFFIGSGVIKGFAMTLAAGIFTSLLTAVVFSRALIHYCYGHRKLKQLPIGL